VSTERAKPELTRRRYGSVPVKHALLQLLQRLRLLRPVYAAYERALAVRVRARGRTPVTSEDGLPIPPSPLIVRVAGTGDVEWFLRSGHLAADAIRQALDRQGTGLVEVGSLLDFGCGCGRVTRRWLGLRGVDVCGSDRDERAVEWCRRNLPFGQFELNGLAPPLTFDDGQFGLVYALSVLTHLPEPLQRAWLRELHRVIRPDGYLLVTTHGEHYLPRLTAPERERFLAGELVVRWEEGAGTNLCAAYHPEEWVRDRLADGFDVIDFVPEGARGNPAQDLYLLRKV
jgi:SAM-dependent methyltransferase